MGWIFVCFDLPVSEKPLMKKAAHFRKFLLKEGYFMLQNSVYVRNCVTYEKSKYYIAKIKEHAPLLGRISIFFLTDKQWENSINIEMTGYNRSKYAIKAQTKMPEQIIFW